MAVTVKFLADVANWVSGLDKSEQAVEQNQEALEDLMTRAVELGRQTGRTTDQIAADFSKAFGVPLDRAKAAIEEVAAETDSLESAAGDAGAQVGEGIADGAATAGDSMTELGSIAQDVLQGDFGSAAESAVGALGLLGPAGLAAGGILALGIGLFTDSLKTADEQQQKLKDSAKEWADTFIQEGSTILSSATLIAKGLDVVKNQYDDVVKNSELWGVTHEQAAAAMAGSQTDIDAITDSIHAQWEATEQQIEADGKITKTTADKQFALLDAGKAIAGVTDAMELGGEQASVYSRLLVDMARNTEGATVSVDEFGDTIYALPDGTQVYVDAETGQATSDVDAITAKIYAVPSSTLTTATVKYVPDDSLIRTWQAPMKYGAVIYDTTGNPYTDRILKQPI